MSLAVGLRQKVDEVFELARSECHANPSLQDLLPVIEARRRTLHQPMRVALVGKTNCGKSTMMNALLGEELAPTGNGELTFNVTWFRYGDERRLLVHTVDGGIEPETFDSLERLTARCEARRDLLERIRWIEVRCPNPLLKKFDLIDTPGLHSFYEKDSKNTRDLLTDEETRPHAVVFLFSGTLQEPDVRELERFHESCGSVMSGLTAIGALTKVDECEHAFDDGRRIVQQIQDRHPQTRRFFFTILPVVGPAAFGAKTLTDGDRQTLLALVALTGEKRSRLLMDVTTFREREYPNQPGMPSAIDRKRLFDRLGRYGIRQAIAMLADGQDPALLPEFLLAASSVERLSRIVEAHFGGRAFLIKARSALSYLREQAFRRGEGPAGSAANRIAGAIDSIILNEPRFREFGVLERHYRGTLPLDPEQLQHVLEITGENGWSCARRLGADDGALVDELLQRADERQRRWQGKAFETFASLEMQEVARVLADSYGAIHERVSEAAEHVRFAAELLAYEL